LYKEEKKNSFLEIVSEGKKQYLQVHEILCIEKENRQLHIHTIQGECYSYQSLSALARKCSKEMVRCHGSYMVNLHYVTHYEREKMTLVNGMIIPIGRTYQEQTKSAYLNYWVDRI
jgi:DNA-binding LytR/AlgR family response regulator